MPTNDNKMKQDYQMCGIMYNVKQIDSASISNIIDFQCPSLIYSFIPNLFMYLLIYA